MNEHARHHDPDKMVPAEIVPRQRPVRPAENVRRPGFWNGLTTIERAAFLVLAQEVVHPAGTVLWTEGQEADHTFVIKSGTVRVSVERDGRERFVAFRGPGDIIGERAALQLRRRSATVVAMDPLHVLCLTTHEFVAYLSDHPHVVAVLEREMYNRMTEQGPGRPPQRVHYPAGAGHPYGTAAQYGSPQPYATAQIPVVPNYPYAMAGPFAVAAPSAAHEPWGGGEARMVEPTAVVNGASATPTAPPTVPARTVPARSRRQVRSLEAAVETSWDRPTQPMVLPDDDGPSWAGQNCTIVYTDVAGFSSPARNDVDRIDVRRAMYRALREAFEESGVPWHACHVEDRGDGALIVIPPQVPTATVVDPMMVSLGRRLRGHNHRASGAVRVQLRVAVNVGPVMPDPPGVSGSSIITAARLLDAGPLKERLAATGADLGVIASRFVYDSVIVPSPGQVTAAEYERITCRVKESDLEGWIHLRGLPALPAF
ncbi:MULTISPECIES: cyclic nucleotide-binding domain-containing protein [unclassified Actinomadura]|uniref:cyclic nucleotide-binding domain-containing protein n=1 Tax=unclassified Actinomadura TaxID=2626254 RepID=UPI0011EBDCB4|nr:cyclic nucleotide-binding domain-containing protein [Actinomadura sp. K4S16]